MNDQSLARSFSVRDEDRDDFFHSSGYAGAQNEGRIGAASRGMTVEERQELSENRKFVRGYENASLAAQVASARERNISMFERGRDAENGGNGFSAGSNSAGSICDPGSPRGVSGASGLSGGNAGSETGVAQGGYRYSDDRARRQEANSYKDYAAMAKQEMTQRGGNTGGNAGSYGGGYGGGRDGIYGGGAGGYGGGAGGYGSGASSGRGFAPNFGGSVERNYGGGQGYGGGQNYGGGNNYGAGQSGGVGRTGQAGLNSAISNTQRFTNNFGMKFGPK
jgi:glycine-rich cell wall structural protein